MTDSPDSPGATRQLGSSDLHVGPIAYGCWRFAGTSVAEGREKIEVALAEGLTLIDTADIYGIDGPGFGSAEELLGEVLALSPELRDQMVLATKGGIDPPKPYDSSATYLRTAIDRSLRRLQVDVIDLYQIHRPDLLGHPGEVAAALADAREAGKIRHVGVSNHTVAQTDALVAHLPFDLITDQPEFSAGHLDPLYDGVLDRCMHRGVTPLAWSPLGGGALLADAENARADGNNRLADLIETLDRIAELHETTRSSVLLAFVLRHPAGIIPIIGTQQAERIRESAAAVSVELTADEWYEIVVASQGAPMP